MQSVEERFLLRTSNAWDGHYARVMFLVLPINKTFPRILNRAERKYPNIFGKCTQTEFLPPPTFKEKTRRHRSPLSPQGRDDGVPEQQPEWVQSEM